MTASRFMLRQGRWEVSLLRSTRLIFLVAARLTRIVCPSTHIETLRFTGQTSTEQGSILLFLREASSVLWD
jgi:hypothetical protein